MLQGDLDWEGNSISSYSQAVEMLDREMAPSAVFRQAEMVLLHL